MPNATSKQTRRNFLQQASLIGSSIPLWGLGTAFAQTETQRNAFDLCGNSVAPGREDYVIRQIGDRIEILAGELTRRIEISNNQIITVSCQVAGEELLEEPTREFRLRFSDAFPNARPEGLQLRDEDKLFWTDDTLSDKAVDNQPVQWKNLITLDGMVFSRFFTQTASLVTHPRDGVSRLMIRVRSVEDNTFKGVSIALFYEVYQGFPVIRKWIEITNNGAKWIKIDELTTEDISLAKTCRTCVDLVPSYEGAGSCLRAFGDPSGTLGVIAGSEVPSALRRISDTGAMGYSNDYFEWVLGPAEHFTSEPVFLMGYSGEVIKTISGHSMPLDRMVEGRLKDFLETCIGLRGASSSVPAPIWCSYSNFLSHISEKEMRKQADIAARIGFETFQLDEGWAQAPTPGGSEPDPRAFPDFEGICRYIADKGMQLGLWISSFRGVDAKDLTAVPQGRNLPFVRTKRGFGMSFCSSWRNYYANDLVYMRDRYGIRYVKEDLTNISYGDIAEGHESRTRKESLLRGLRGLLSANDRVGKEAPDLWTQVTHEMYWRTPGPAADIAVLKHACAFHTSPNTYYGAGNASEPVSPAWSFRPAALRADLIRGCWAARQRFFEHRGLPLYSIEFYAAHTVSYKGSLTPAVQDRQLCSWLMGAPTVFAGDLSSLSDDQIAHYRNRFDMLKRLQHKYDIYHYFQYSGVPKPTDTGWHWWGKLNGKDGGVVVVLRGSAGEDSRQVNIPWVRPNQHYSLTALFSGRRLGQYIGRELSTDGLELSLPVYGQEIIEVTLS